MSFNIVVPAWHCLVIRLRIWFKALNNPYLVFHGTRLPLAGESSNIISLGEHIGVTSAVPSPKTRLSHGPSDSISVP